MRFVLFILYLITLYPQVRVGAADQDSGWRVGSEKDGRNQKINDLKKIKELDLVSAQRIALRNNPEIHAVTARIEVAASLVRQELSAYYPRISTQFSGTKVQDRPNDQSFGAEGVKGEQYLAKFTAKWLLFDNNVRKLKIKAAEFNKISSTEAAREAQMLLLDTVTQTFYDALLAHQQKETALANIDFQQNFIDEIKTKQRLGSASSADVLNFELRRETAKIDLLNANKKLNFGKILLVQLMGVSDDIESDEITLKEALVKELPTIEHSLEHELSKALELRADLRRMEAIVEKSKLEVESQYRSLFPQLEFVADLRSFRRDSLGFESDDLGASYGLVAKWDLYAGGKNLETYRSKKEELRVAELELENQINVVESEIKQNIKSIGSAVEKLIVQQEINRLTQEIRNTIEKEYKAGVASITRLNEVQKDLVFAEQNLASTWIEYHLARTKLDSSTGKNLDYINHLESILVDEDDANEKQ